MQVIERNGEPVSAFLEGGGDAREAEKSLALGADAILAGLFQANGELAGLAGDRGNRISLRGPEFHPGAFHGHPVFIDNPAVDQHLGLRVQSGKQEEDDGPEVSVNPRH